MKSIVSLSLLLSLAAPGIAQTLMLTTTLAGGNGQNGNMFDISATGSQSVTIVQFDQNMRSGSVGMVATMEIYAVTGGGSYVGKENTPNAWTLIGSTMITALATGTPTPLPIPIGVTIPPMGVQGFYVTRSVGPNVEYTSGTNLGAPFASDANITFYEGIGSAYPFGSIFSPRIWNGVIRYQLGSMMNEFQVNQAGASFDINGIMGTASVPASPTLGINQSGIMTLSSMASGTPWELGVGNSPLLSASGGALVTSDGQILNLDLSDPTVVYFWSGFASPPFSNAVIPVSFPSAHSLSAQMAVIDPFAPFGLSISQPVRLTVQ